MDYILRNKLRALDKQDKQEVIRIQKENILLEQEFMNEQDNYKRASIWNQMKALEAKRDKVISKYKTI